MTPELEKVCEETAYRISSPMLRSMVSRTVANEMCKESFTAAIESEQVQGLVRVVELFTEDYTSLNKRAEAKQALEKFRGE